MLGSRRAAASASAELDTRVGDDPAIVTNARVREFHDYWLARRGERRFPARSDIEPTGVPHLREGIAVSVYRQGRPMVVSRVHCPLSSNGDTIDKIISCLAFLED